MYPTTCTPVAGEASSWSQAPSLPVRTEVGGSPQTERALVVTVVATRPDGVVLRVSNSYRSAPSREGDVGLGPEAAPASKMIFS